MPEPTVRDFRRAQIVAAARTLVAEEGLAGLTIGALETRLGYSRGVITYHFRDKDEIVSAVLSSAVAEIDAATVAGVQASATFEDMVRAVLRTKVGGFVERLEATRIVFSFLGRIGADPRVRKINAELYAGYRKQAAGLIRAGKAIGACAADVSVDAMAVLLVGLVIGITAQNFFAPGAIDTEAAIEEACKTVLARTAPRPARRGAGARGRRSA